MRAATSRDSAWMLAAIGALAYLASLMTHEALGHGLYCFAAGGHNTTIMPWWETCSFPGKLGLGIKAAGPLAQCAGGLLAWILLQRVPASAIRLRSALWLYMSFCLLISTGYVAFSAVTGAGDAGELLAAVHASFAWRGTAFLLGSLGYFLSMRAGGYELKRLAGPDHGLQRLFRLVWVPYVSAGAFACCVAAIGQVAGHGSAKGLAAASPGLNQLLGMMGMAVLSSFGATAGMFGMPSMGSTTVARARTTSTYLGWSPAWGVSVGTLLVIALIYVGLVAR